MNKDLLLRLYAGFILGIEIFYVLIQTGSFIIESDLTQWIYGPSVGSTAFIYWNLPNITSIPLIYGIWNWRKSNIAKASAIVGILGYTLLYIILYLDIIALFAWFFGIIVVINYFSLGIHSFRKKNEAKRSEANIISSDNPKTDSERSERKNRNKTTNANAILNKKINLNKKIILKTVFLYSILMLPLIIPLISSGSRLHPEPEIREMVSGGDTFEIRRDMYLDDTKDYGGKWGQISRLYLGLPVNDNVFLQGLEEITGIENADFLMNCLVRALYLDQLSHILLPETKNILKETFLLGSYWFDQPNGTRGCIYWTENHQIAYLTAELLVGQLYPDDNFYYSGMNGTEHVNHAKREINKWIDWKARFGFSEWHSNVYLEIDMYSLVNLVDFAEDDNISLRAAMVLDLICFDFANNYFNNTYAINHARAYQGTLVGSSSQFPPERADVDEAAWLLLGIGNHRRNARPEQGATSIATSIKYTPPEILELIAEDATDSNEAKERTGFNIADGPSLGMDYNEENLMFYWGAAGVITPWTIDLTFNMIQKYNLNPGLVMGDGIPEVLRFASLLRGTTLSEYATLIREISEGIAIQSANSYTYRTPNYQLNGVQDYKKGLNGIQEHIWQASLSEFAYVFTSAPGGIGFKGGPFVGGWYPKGTFYKNVGIIQYDHAGTLDTSIVTGILDLALNYISGNRPYNHAYFPRWAFDEVRSVGSWTFGKKDGGYIGLFSSSPTFWISDYELVAFGKKNAWIVELGGSEYDSFDEFIENVSSSEVFITPLALGYDIHYNSPSQGNLAVTWEGPLLIDESPIDIGPYDRWENPYSTTAYNSLRTIIEFENYKLTLDFENNSRLYEIF